MWKFRSLFFGVITGSELSLPSTIDSLWLNDLDSGHRLWTRKKLLYVDIKLLINFYIFIKLKFFISYFLFNNTGLQQKHTLSKTSETFLTLGRRFLISKANAGETKKTSPLFVQFTVRVCKTVQVCKIYWLIKGAG